MNLAKMSKNGSISLPVEIQRFFGLKPGDKVLFYQNGDGEIVVDKASADSLKKAQIGLLTFRELAKKKEQEDEQLVFGSSQNGDEPLPFEIL